MTISDWQVTNLYTLASELSSLRWNVDTAINCHPGVSYAERGINVCRPLDGHYTGCPVCQRHLVDVKDNMVSFAKTRRAIIGTLIKLQIPALTYMEHE